MSNLKYPIGVQSFEDLIQSGYTYVDKTSYIRQLVENGKTYFLGRPRRFGKSLLLSTLEAFFEGKRELFKGLVIDEWEEWNWAKHPVIHIDLNAKNYMLQESLQEKIDLQLSYYEEEYNLEVKGQSLDGRFQRIIKQAYEVTGQKVVVLIDEYDKPILDTLHDDHLKELHRDNLRAFYSVLKSSDRYLKFCFLTGVTKFGQLNVFSGLNNLEDISLSNSFAGICGITEQELHAYFDSGVAELGKEWGWSHEKAYSELKRNYDGYHFSPRLLDVYNPWSVLNSLKVKMIGAYWITSGGSMSMLYNLIKHNKMALTDFDHVVCLIEELQGINIDNHNTIPLLYQTGYLTIESFNPDESLFTLKFPNYEVRRGFIKGLLPTYTGADERNSVFTIMDFVADVRKGDVDAMLKRMQTFFAGFPYENALKTEKDFQNVMYCVMAMMGLQVKVEQHSSLGSADMVVQTEDYVYIFEFKVDKSPDDALRQIEEKGYAAPFANDPRRLIRVGVTFSLSERNLSSWKIEG